MGARRQINRYSEKQFTDFENGRVFIHDSFNSDIEYKNANAKKFALRWSANNPSTPKQVGGKDWYKITMDEGKYHLIKIN